MLLLLSSWLIHVPMTMRLCNSRIPEEHLVCYQMSQRNWVIIKMLYRCLRRCLLSWHRSRLGFITPSIGEVSLGPPGNAQCYLLSMRWFYLEEERVMHQSSVSISLSLWEPRYQSSRRLHASRLIHTQTNKNIATNAIKGLSSPS